jgi:hypothetical protein
VLALFRGAQRRRLANPVLAVSRSRADARAATLTVERVKDGEVSPIFWMSYASATNLSFGDLSADISSGPAPQGRRFIFSLVSSDLTLSASRQNDSVHQEDRYYG